MGFGPYNRTLKIWESIWDSNSYNGSSFGSLRVHSLTLFALLGACDSWVSLLARNLTTPCLGREPKVRVVTFWKFTSS